MSRLSILFKRFLRKTGLMSLATKVNNFRCYLIKQFCLLVGKNPLEYIYTDDFFSVSHHQLVLKDTPSVLAELIQSRYSPKSVVDFGCGCGMYLYELESRGIEIFGIDGSPAAKRNLIISRDQFRLADVTSDIILPKRYDIAMCLEVAEHIPTSASPTLVKNVTQYSDLVVFSSAHKGQGGHDHINEQDPRFWIDLFNQRDFEFLVEDTQKIKDELSKAKAIFWLVDNIAIFRKR